MSNRIRNLYMQLLSLFWLITTCQFTCAPDIYSPMNRTQESAYGWCTPTTWHRLNLSLPYSTQSNGTLEVFHMYLKLTLEKLCENDLDNWDQHQNQVLANYCVTPNLATGDTQFPLFMGGTPFVPLYQLLEAMQCFHGDPDSKHLNLKMHHLALAIAKKTLDENRFRNTQKATDHPAL